MRFVGEALVPQLARELGVLFLLGGERLERHHRGVAALRERAVLVEHVSDAAGHAGRKVSSTQTQNNDRAAGHIFATMVADALDHRLRA